MHIVALSMIARICKQPPNSIGDEQIKSFGIFTMGDYAAIKNEVMPLEEIGGHHVSMQQKEKYRIISL